MEDGENLVTLYDGRVVCHYCPDWAQECLARELLSFPLAKRRERLARFTEGMKPEALESLKTLIVTLHTKDRSK